MRNWIIGFILAALCVPTVALAAQYFDDPCAGSGTVTVPISATTAATQSLVAPVTGAYINVCNWGLFTVGGTGQIEYGTGATCGTGTQTLTGPIPASTSLYFNGGGHSVLDTNTKSQRLCFVAGASTTATAGWVTYVQTPIQGY